MSILRPPNPTPYLHLPKRTIPTRNGKRLFEWALRKFRLHQMSMINGLT